MTPKFIESNSLWDKAWMALKDRDYPLFDEVMERFWEVTGRMPSAPRSRPFGIEPLRVSTKGFDRLSQGER